VCSRWLAVKWVMFPLCLRTEPELQDERIPGLYSKYENHQKANHSMILLQSLFRSHPIVWENVYQALFSPQTLEIRTTTPVQGTNPLQTMQTGYSGIITPLIKKSVSMKAW
jgi:hypothetical protein